MSGYDLSEGVFRTGNYSEEQLWKAFRNVFLLKHRIVLAINLYF